MIRVAIGLLGTVLIASPIFVPLYRFEYTATQGQSVIGAPISLFVVFVLLLPMWMRRAHQCSRPWARLGFSNPARWWASWLLAFIVGVVGVILLYSIQTAMGWGNWSAPDLDKLLRNLAEGLLVGFGVGLAEELLFRGWLLFELEQSYSAPVALAVDALIFAIAHYLRPVSEIVQTWPQFLGLFLLGTALVWARRIPFAQGSKSSDGRLLGPAAGLHGGLVFAYYQVDVNDLVITANTVPDWLTGIGGNPLAGLLGLILLSIIALGTYLASHRSMRNSFSSGKRRI